MISRSRQARTASHSSSRFQTEEYPEFVNSAYNDGFIAELDTSDWNVSGSTISAPHNFAFDNGGHIVSVNSSFFDPGQVVVATGTQYDGSTPLLNVQTPVTPGLHSLYLSIFDASDHILDSGAFVDGLKTGHVAEGSCKPGAGERGDLKVIKHVVNDDGGTKSAADFTSMSRRARPTSTEARSPATSRARPTRSRRV